MKVKPLLPTLRTKKRYVVYETVSEKSIEHLKVVEAIFKSYKECFGLFGLAQAGLTDMKINSSKRGILKINHKYVEQLRAAMALIKEIDNVKVILHTVGVSGILKKTRGKYMEGIKCNHYSTR